MGVFEKSSTTVHLPVYEIAIGYMWRIEYAMKVFFTKKNENIPVEKVSNSSFRTFCMFSMKQWTVYNCIENKTKDWKQNNDSTERMHHS